MKRKWHVENKKDLVLLVDEATKALSEAKAVLKTESSPAGQKLRSLLAGSNKELRNWMDRYKCELDSIRQEMGESSTS